MSAPATYLDNSIILYIIIMILNILNIYYRKTSYAQVGPFHSETLLSRLSPLSMAPVPAAGLVDGVSAGRVVGGYGSRLSWQWGDLL